ncbi:hypothetical protein JCGZ_03122 [Jatropha curcas]|uniref:Uncharacterized protein n=1 Tax=Jatropha curcas TaxID=180498 RepID=A0A067JQX7_JATCU|nr:hypothetical protein JCGZ_03122 [Jatropha curcas]
MALPSYSSDEDFLGSLGISLDEVDLMADADSHASMTGIFAQDSRIKLDVAESSVAGISLEIFGQNSPVGAIIRPSYLGYLRAGFRLILISSGQMPCLSGGWSCHTPSYGDIIWVREWTFR